MINVKTLHVTVHTYQVKVSQNRNRWRARRKVLWSTSNIQYPFHDDDSTDHDDTIYEHCGSQMIFWRLVEVHC